MFVQACAQGKLCECHNSIKGGGVIFMVILNLDQFDSIENNRRVSSKFLHNAH